MNAPATQIPPDELAWAVECAEAGDTVADIAEGSGRSPDEWRAALGAAGVICLKPLEDCDLDRRDAVVARRYVDGVPLRRIGLEIGVSKDWARTLADRLITAGVMQRRPQLGPSAETLARLAERARARGQRFPARDRGVLDLIQSGLTYTVAGRHFGITRQAVSGIVYRAVRRAEARA